MMGGNMPADGGNLIIETEDYADFIKRDPKATKYIKRYMMGNEFINGIVRYCLWLVDATPQELHDMPMVRERVRLCREDRLNGAPDRQKLADTPHLFREKLNPKSYIANPVTSSENRKYIPMGWLDDDVIAGDGLRIISDATMPADLRKAHRENDAAVCEAYGWTADVSESEIVAMLFALYQSLYSW